MGGSTRRKRKIPDSVNVTPDRSSPLKRIRNQSLEISEDEDSETGTIGSRDDAEDPLRKHGRQPKSTEPIIGSIYRGGQGQYLRREIGLHRRGPGSGYLGRGVGVSKEWQQVTTHFSTIPEDAHICMNVAAPSDHTIPFCSASCNSKFR